MATGSVAAGVVLVLVRVSAVLSSSPVPVVLPVAVWLLLEVPCDEDESEKSSEDGGGV